MRNKSRSVLLKTSSISSLLHSGSDVTIAGLDGGPIRYNDILDIKQVKQRAEVPQVVTGGITYTPTANTTYAIEVYLSSQKVKGWQGFKKKYGYTTPSVLTVIGANAAAQREYINGKIVDAINADAANFMTAASLGGGTGITLTDDAGYFPARLNGASNGRGGAAAVITITNSDGSGFVAADFSVTTDAVYGFGDGTRMANDIPVIYSYTGNLISGELDAPKASDGTYAIAGQKYDAFVITSWGSATSHQVSGQVAHTPEETVIFVDNGTGTSTSNLTGFQAFERAMHRLLFSLYANNPNAIVEFFDNIVAVGGNTGTGLPTGTAQDTNTIVTGANVLHYSPIATSTLLSMVHSADGLKLELDSTDNEGVELGAPVSTASPKQFIVGQQEFSLYAKLKISDVSGTDDMAVGFRKKEAYQAAIDNYDEMAVLNVISGDIKIETILNGAATTVTDTTLNWADDETHDLEVRVLIDGTVKFLVDGVDKSSVQTTAFVFDAGEVVIPFVYSLQATDLSNNNIKAFVAVPTAYWKL
jgi:hypothetical protein